MKKIILIFTVLIFTCLSSESLAQKAITKKVGAVTYNAVIDNIALPAGVLKTKEELKNEKETNGQMKTHASVPIDRDDLLDNPEIIGLKVSPLFAVATTNTLSSESATMNYTIASNICATHTEGDNQTYVWRLPTNRELHLILHTRTQLEATEDFATFSVGRYWSSTTYYKNGQSVLGFSGDSVTESTIVGNDDIAAGTTKLYVRCIRDL